MRLLDRIVVIITVPDTRPFTSNLHSPSYMPKSSRWVGGASFMHAIP